MTPSKPFVVVPRQQPTDAHTLGLGTGVITKKELDRPSCPSCFRPGLYAGYCDSCTTTGAALRHLKNQARA